MKKYLFPQPDGKFLTIRRNIEDSALPHITKRIEYHLPVECIDVKDVQNIINYVRVRVNRDCTAEEVNAIVEQIRGLLLEALEHMTKYERHHYDMMKKGDYE